MQSKNKQTIAEVIIMHDVKKADLLEDKLKILSDYYGKLYETLGPMESDFIQFKDSIDLPKL